MVLVDLMQYLLYQNINHVIIILIKLIFSSLKLQFLNQL